MRYDTPCLKKDWHFAHLMSDNAKHVIIDGLEMTAKNIWEYEGSREYLLEKLVDYFYNVGFQPIIEITDKDIEKDFLKLVNIDSKSAVDNDGSLKNTSYIGLDICKIFCQQSFYSTRVNGTASIYDVYKDKELLRKILKNRMGWYTTTEKLVVADGTILEGEHPYLFDISHKMIVQGAHSSMISANTSNFRPLIAKYLMEKFCPKLGVVLDLSAGWGARLLAALSLHLDYYGIDPMTSKELNRMYSFLTNRQKLFDKWFNAKTNDDVQIIDGMSEDLKSYKSFTKKVDYVISCPPYFKLEEYNCKNNSTDVYSEYEDWLEKYWRQTIKNTLTYLKSTGKFTLIIVEKWGKYNLLNDMKKIIEEEGMNLIDELSYKTMRSHLTNKRETKNITKNTEKILTFERN